MEEEASSDSLATSEEYELVCPEAPRLSIAGNGSQDQLQSHLGELLAEGPPHKVIWGIVAYARGQSGGSHRHCGETLGVLFVFPAGIEPV